MSLARQRQQRQGLQSNGSKLLNPTNTAKNDIFGATNVNTPQKKSTADEARSITMSLRRTNQMLHHELDRVSCISSAMDQDGRVLNETKSSHDEMKDGIKGAKGALRGLEREKQKERRVLTASVLFFYSVVAYVVWTRIRIPFLLW